MPFIQRDKKVVPGHSYSHTEGHEDHPQHYFQDKNNNYVRYTNAPSGHKANASSAGDAVLHPSEPTIESAPDFFTPDGRKLVKAPYPGAPVEWNQSYHPEDPKNIWAGRWVDPPTGEHHYTYLDTDVRNTPRMQMYFQNCYTDARLIYFRQYYHQLFSSPMLKDQIVSLILALIDQGRFGTEELMEVTSDKVQIMGNLLRIGKRWVLPDHKFISAVDQMMTHHHPHSPIFSVPVVKKNNEVDEELIRIIGPHYLHNILEMHGMSLIGLFTYHATQTFSREIERVLGKSEVSWIVALTHALEAVAVELGFDLAAQPDKVTALMAIKEKLVDPIVISVLKANAERAGLVTEGNDLQLPPPGPTIMPISMDLLTRTPFEDAFSKWLHSFPVHNYVEDPDKDINNQAPAAPL